MLDRALDHVAAALLLRELHDVSQHESAEALTLLGGRHVDDALDDVVAVVVLDQIDGFSLQRLNEFAAILRAHDIGTFDDDRAAIFLSRDLVVRRGGETHSRTVCDDMFVEREAELLRFDVQALADHVVAVAVSAELGRVLLEAGDDHGHHVALAAILGEVRGFGWYGSG